MKNMIKMRNIVIALLFFISAIFLVSFMSTKKADTRKQIAIFTPATHPALEEIERGFKETINSLSYVEPGFADSYSFTVINANGNKTLLQAQAQEIANGDYDLVFTIGCSTSQAIAQRMQKKNNKTPHVFCAVDGAEYAQSLRDINRDSAGTSYSCGVYVQDDYVTQMAIIHTLKPGIKNIMLVYDPLHGAGLEKYKDLIVDYNKNSGVTVHCIEVYQANEIQQKVSALLPDMDAVLVLTDNTVVTGIDVLVNLCNRYGVTLCASDLESGKKGAAFAYGVTEHESGASAARLAVSILVDGKKPEDLAPAAVDGFRIAINRSTMYAQKLFLQEGVLQEIERTGALFDFKKPAGFLKSVAQKSREVCAKKHERENHD